ncbi:MAG: hypothetical protein KatS3mg104_0411 [Phycisphaerae bacterium]|jgi:hypothetical protein|nr:MAG: hypothetical protein KatS3mg104_0411 [Phycisphaerae bacterium]
MNWLGRFLQTQWKPIGGLILVFWVITALPARAATHEQIQASIERGVRFLYSKQNEFGNWERTQQRPVNTKPSGTDEGQWGGRTSLVTYALLAAGEKPLDPRIVKATDWLRDAPITGHYALGVRANVWLNLPPTQPNREALMKDARLLLSGVSKTGVNRGFYDYQPGGNRLDISCSQYGVLGMWAAAQWLEEIPASYWNLIEPSWRNQQGGEGGWAYNGKNATADHPYSLQMTAAGVATLFITQEFLHANDGIEGNKGNIIDPWINKGLSWIAKNFPILVTDSGYKNRLYTFYGIERIGVASGYKYFGKLDWFAQGAEAIVRSQSSNGSWNNSEIDTAFALLFLSRGGAPVMMNKLQYNITNPKAKDPQTASKEANWNQRPRDVANATRWVGQKTERMLNWQIINLNVASMRDLYDSPILYITGNQTLSFTDKEKAMLKQYVESGGLIIGNADVGKNEFVRSFRSLASELFPEYEFMQLADQMDHPLLVNQQFNASSWKRKPRLEALGNRARLFMILIPNDDFSRALQLRDRNREEIFEFFANAYLYSTDKKPGKFKGYTHVVTADPKIQPSTEIKIARIKYTGRWDPEPGGWRQLSARMHNQDKISLSTQAIDPETDSLTGFKIAHLTGTDAFTFNDEQRKAIKSFIDAGGLLVIDSCGGFAEFDSSVQNELSKIFPNEVAQLTQPLKSDHLIYTLADGKKVEPQYRVYAQLKLGADALRFRLRGMTVNGKLAVIYSPDDLSVGLVGNDIDGIIGYEPEVATTLMRQVILLKTAGKI